MRDPVQIDVQESDKVLFSVQHYYVEVETEDSKPWLRGKVVASATGRVEVEVQGSNAWGNHVTATLTLETP